MASFASDIWATASSRASFASDIACAMSTRDIVRETDTGELMDMRDLANYAGAAHIRTPDGSSFTCDIQVSEDASYGTSKVSYNLTIKGIGAQEPDGMTLAEWLENHPVG